MKSDDFNKKWRDAPEGEIFDKIKSLRFASLASILRKEERNGFLRKENRKNCARLLTILRKRRGNCVR